MLSIPPKLQQAFDQDNLEPVTYVELITEVLDAPASQNPAISGTNVDLTNTEEIRMNYPDSAGAVSTFVDLGKTDQIVGARMFGTFKRGDGFPTTFSGASSIPSNTRSWTIAYQSFTLGEDRDSGQANRLKKLSFDLSTKSSKAGIFEIKCSVFGVSGDNFTIIGKNGLPAQAIEDFNSGHLSSTSYSVPAGTTAKASIPFTFDDTLVAGRRYAAVLYLRNVSGATVGSTNSMAGEWYGSRASQFPDERSWLAHVGFTAGELSMKVELAEYDPSPSPVVVVKMDVLETPTEAGEFSILDRNEAMIDPVTGLQETSISYHAWTTDATYVKGTGLDLGVIDISDPESLKIQTTELSRYYLLEATLSATTNGLRSPTFIGAIVKFPKTGSLARLSSHPLPNFTDEVMTAIKSVSIAPTKFDISNPIAKRGKSTINLVDVDGQVTRMAIKQHLLNLTAEIRVGHAPTAKNKDDFALMFAGKVTDYSYKEKELSLTIEDRTKNFDVKIPRIGQSILNSGKGTLDTGDVRKSWKSNTIVNMLKDIIVNETGILSRYIDTTSIDAWGTTLKAGDTQSPWITPKELKEPEEAKDLIKEILILGGAYLVSLEDGKLRIIQWPRSGTALGSWDADILTVDDNQPKGVVKSLVNLCMVSFDKNGDGSNKGLSVSADSTSIKNFAPGSELHISDRVIKTTLLGDQLHYNGETIANKIADRVVKTYKDGVVPMSVVTPFNQFKFQAGDFINITSPVFLKKFNLGSSARKFMITEKRPDIHNNKISWSLMEDINHNRLPTAAFTADVTSGTPTFNVQFTDASTDSDGTINAWAWDFDYDGVNFTDPPDSILQNPSASFTSSNIGIKRVRLRVTDDLGGQDETELTIRVLGAPTAIITAIPSAPDQPPTTTLVSSSHGRTGSIVKTEWDVAYDGTTFVADFEGESTSVVHLASELIVALRVTDEDGFTDIETITIPKSKRAILPGDSALSMLTSIWREVPTPLNSQILGMAYGSGAFVGVGFQNLGQVPVIRSVDGEEWTDQSITKPTVNLRDVQSSGSLFVAVGDPDGTDAFIVTSSDGLSWAEKTNPKNFKLNAVAYSKKLDMWCGVGDADGTDSYVVTSVDDGATWQEQANPKNVNLNGVTWSDDREEFLAVGAVDFGISKTYVIQSTNGTSWAQLTPNISLSLGLIVYGAGLYCSIGGGLDPYTSPDGVTWTQRTNPKALALSRPIYTGYFFLIVAGSASGAYMIGSQDGKTWTTRIEGLKSNSLTSVAWDGRKLVVGGAIEVSADVYVAVSLSLF